MYIDYHNYKRALIEDNVLKVNQVSNNFETTALKKTDR